MKLPYTIPRHSLDHVEAFLRIAEFRSFRAAAESLGLSPSALSQKIRVLERQAGIALLTRTTRKVGLTQAGQLFLDRAKPAFVELSAAFEEAQNLGQPSGLLRLHMPRGIIPVLVEPILADFCAAYPKIDLEIFAGENGADLIDEGFDAGVMLGEFLDADVIGLRLTDPIRFAIVGSPSYFRKYGRPERPADLVLHRCTRMRLGHDRLGRWAFLEAGRSIEIAVNGQLITNDHSLTVASAVNGVGLSYVAKNIIRPLVESGALETVLDAFMPTSTGVFLYYNNRSQVLPKLRAFVDFLKEKRLSFAQ